MTAQRNFFVKPKKSKSSSRPINWKMKQQCHILRFLEMVDVDINDRKYLKVFLISTTLRMIWGEKPFYKYRSSACGKMTFIPERVRHVLWLLGLCDLGVECHQLLPRQRHRQRRREVGQREGGVLQPLAEDGAVALHQLEEDVPEVVQGEGGQDGDGGVHQGVDEAGAEGGLHGGGQGGAVDGGRDGGGDGAGDGVAAGGEVGALLPGAAGVDQVEEELHDGGVGVAVLQAGRVEGQGQDGGERGGGEVGEGGALEEAGVQAEEVVHGVGMVLGALGVLGKYGGNSIFRFQEFI